MSVTSSTTVVLMPSCEDRIVSHRGIYQLQQHNMKSIANTIPFLLIIIVGIRGAIAKEGTWAIQTFPAYSSQRRCGQYCLDNAYTSAGCVSPYYNECICRPNVRPTATSYLSYCVSLYGCDADDVDIKAALTVFEDYCSKAGAPATATLNEPATSSTLPATVARPTSPQVTVYVTQISSSTRSMSSSISELLLLLFATSTLSATGMLYLLQRL